MQHDFLLLGLIQKDDTVQLHPYFAHIQNDYWYNNENAGQDSNDGTQNDYGQVYAMNIRVEEIEASEVSQFSSQNTFASGG